MPKPDKKTVDTSEFRMVFPNADEELEKIATGAAELKYGAPLPGPVRERLELELNAIKEGNYASEYLIGATIARRMRTMDYPISSRGTISSSFVAHLCGFTEVNPLPAHYRCPKCHHFELAGEDYRVMGYDLPDKKCPACGASLYAEGADILPEVLMGCRFDRDPELAFNIAPENRLWLFGQIMEIYGKDRVIRAGTKAVDKEGNIRRGFHPGGVYILPEGADITKVTDLRKERTFDGMLVTEEDYRKLAFFLRKYDLLELKEMGMLYSLEQQTGVSMETIKLNDPELLDVFLDEGLSFLPGYGDNDMKEMVKGAIRDAHPSYFSDLVRITALLRGTDAWNDNVENLIREGKPLRDCAATRDDIYQELLKAGMEKERAYGIMRNVRTGRGLTEDMEVDMRQVWIPEWYISSCKKMKYLFPRSHATEYAIIYARLAYYRKHYPDEYRKQIELRDKSRDVPV